MAETRKKCDASPSSRRLSWSDYSVDSYDIKVERYLSDVPRLFLDEQAVKGILARKDRLLYVVYTNEPLVAPGELAFDSVVIHPGLIGTEYHMTKGHRHNGEGAEIYLGLRGVGYVLLQSPKGQFIPVEFGRGVVAYIPPGWAHRTVNTGKVPLCFFGVYPSGLDQDYAAVERVGFSKIVAANRGSPEIVDNPRYHPG